METSRRSLFHGSILDLLLHRNFSYPSSQISDITLFKCKFHTTLDYYIISIYIIYWVIEFWNLRSRSSLRCMGLLFCVVNVLCLEFKYYSVNLSFKFRLSFFSLFLTQFVKSELKETEGKLPWKEAKVHHGGQLKIRKQKLFSFPIRTILSKVVHFH